MIEFKFSEFYIPSNKVQDHVYVYIHEGGHIQ